MVESGEASWEAVEFPAQKAKAAKCVIPAVDAVAKRDRYGFHESSASKKLVKDGNASLFEALAVCKPPTYLLSSSDPMPVRLPDGHFSTWSNSTQVYLGLFTNECQWLIWVDQLSLGLSYLRRLALALTEAVQGGRKPKLFRDGRLCSKWRGFLLGFLIPMIRMEWNWIMFREKFQIT
jgi:hypothetical protein